MFESLRRERPIEELEPHRTVKRYVRCEDKIRLYFFDGTASPVMSIDEFLDIFNDGYHNYNWIGGGRVIHRTEGIPFLFLGRPVTLSGAVVYLDNGRSMGWYAPKISHDLESRIESSRTL